jgi:hypothetical protein
VKRSQRKKVSLLTTTGRAHDALGQLKLLTIPGTTVYISFDVKKSQLLTRSNVGRKRVKLQPKAKINISDHVTVSSRTFLFYEFFFPCIKQLKVTNGRFRGESGIVKRSGHGFYSVLISGRGEVMKVLTSPHFHF